MVVDIETVKKNFLFAFFSSPTSIDMCGKRLKLLAKYALSCDQPNYEFLQYILLWAWPSDGVDRNPESNLHCNSVLLGS